MKKRSANELCCRQLAAGKRTYFISVKISREGIKYLKISERMRQENGAYKGVHIVIFEEFMESAIPILQEAFLHFPPLSERAEIPPF